MGNKRIVVFLLGLVLAFVNLAEAQQAKKIPRLGILSARSPGPLASFDALQQGLRDLGYIEGQSIVIDYRYARGKSELLPDLAVELVSLKPDVIFTHTAPGVLAAKKATSSIPIVSGAAGDLVERGIVESLARPGGNVTGLTLISLDLDSKRIELLKEAAPKISRVAYLFYPANPAFEQRPRVLEDVARAFGLRLQSVEVHGISELEAAFSTMTKTRANAVMVANNPILSENRKQIVELAVRNRLLTIHEQTEFAEAGGLISYGADLPDLFRRAASYIDKILKGTKPTDLPVERPRKFEMVINLKTAKEIGVTIPPNMLVRANKVIK
jgi:putative ABC transport system substrate-binding protein